MIEQTDEEVLRDRLHYAAGEGDLAEVRRLVGEGFDVNAFDTDLSYAPLHHAARGEHLDVVSFLLAAGADVNACDEVNIGATPLGAVAANCSYEMARVLVAAGANPLLPGWMQISALDRARGRRKKEGLRVYELLEKTAITRFNHAR